MNREISQIMSLQVKLLFKQLNRFVELLAYVANFGAITVLLLILSPPASAKDLKWQGIDINQISILDESELRELIPKIVRDLNHIDFSIWGAGCEARAHEMAYYLNGQSIQVAKVFIEGPGIAKRAWGFHVAVAVRTSSKMGIDSLLIIDPPFGVQPYTVDGWIEAATLNDPKVQVTVSTPFIYKPGAIIKDVWFPELKEACETNRWNRIFVESKDDFTNVMLGKKSLWDGANKPLYCQ